MYLIRDVFRCKPGKAKDLVAIFKNARPHMERMGVSGARVMTDSVSTYWTVVLELEVESMAAYEEILSGRQASPELGEIMKGYMDCVSGGHREIFKVE